MNDLHIENYDAEEVSKKKQKILMHIAYTGSVIGVVVSLFGLAVLGCPHDSSRSTSQHQIVISDMYRHPGGSGSWFTEWPN